MEGDDAVRLYEVAIIGAGFDGLSSCNLPQGRRHADARFRPDDGIFGSTACLLACFFGPIGAPPISRIQTLN
jgi:hypothetical protein